MSVDYRSLYVSKMNRLGTNRRDRAMNHKRREFIKYFEDALNREDCLINGAPARLIFQDHSQSNNKDLSDDKYIIAENSTNIGVGDYVNWRDSNWLVFTEEKKTIPTHQQLKIKVVNWSIKFMKDGRLMEYGAYVQNQTLYTLGVATSGDYISVVNGKMMMYVQKNEDTMRYLTVGSRVVIGVKVYKIMFADIVSRNGLINLLMEEDTISAYDNIELGVADYYNIDGKPEDEGGEGDIEEDTLATIEGDGVPKLGRTYTYNIEEGFEVEEWVIDYIDEFGQPFYVLDKNDKYIRIQIKDDFRYVGKTANIIARLSNGSHISLPIRIAKKF